MKNYRKVIMYTEALTAFVLALCVLHLSESAAILAVGTSISAFLAGGVWGNVQEHKAQAVVAEASKP